MIPTIDQAAAYPSGDSSKRQMMGRLIGAGFWVALVGLVWLTASLLG